MATITVYSDAYYAGNSQVLSPGSYNMDQLATVGNDTISSVLIPAGQGLTVTLYADANFSGATKVLTESNTFLSDFNDVTSSIMVTSSQTSGTPAGWNLGITQNDYFAFTDNGNAMLSWDSSGNLRNNQGLLTNAAAQAPNVGQRITPMTLHDWTFGTTENGFLIIIRNQDVKGLICPSGQLYSVVNGTYNLLIAAMGSSAPADTNVPSPASIGGGSWSMGGNGSQSGFVMLYNGSPVFFFDNNGPILGNTSSGWTTFQNCNNDVANTGPVTDSFYQSVATVGTDIGRGMIDTATLGMAELVGYLSPSAASSLSNAEQKIGDGIATATTAVAGAGETAVNAISNAGQTAVNAIGNAGQTAIQHITNPDTWNPTKW